jgi:hypothetical protein
MRQRTSLLCVSELWSQLHSCCKLCDPSFIVKSINDCETRPLLLDVAQSRTSLPVITELGFDWNSASYLFLKKGSSEPKLDPCRVVFSLPHSPTCPLTACRACDLPLTACWACYLPLTACGALCLPPDNAWCLLVIVRRNTKNISFPGKSKNHLGSLGLKRKCIYT